MRHPPPLSQALADPLFADIRAPADELECGEAIPPNFDEEGAPGVLTEAGLRRRIEDEVRAFS